MSDKGKKSDLYRFKVWVGALLLVCFSAIAIVFHHKIGPQKSLNYSNSSQKATRKYGSSSR